MIEPQRYQLCSYSVSLNILTNLERNGLVRQKLLRHHFFRQSFRICNHRHIIPLFQTAQHFGAKNLVCSIFLPILDGTPVRRREKQDIRITIGLNHIVIEISGLLTVIKHKHIY